MSCVCLPAVPIDAALFTIIPLFFLSNPPSPSIRFLRRTSILPSLTPGQALECYKCKLGFWNLCLTTKTTCENGEHCFSGVGKAGEEPRRRKSHPATFCTVAISVRLRPATAHNRTKKKHQTIISHTYLFFSLNDKCPAKLLSISSAALFLFFVFPVAALLFSGLLVACVHVHSQSVITSDGELFIWIKCV